jgi:hypothetical protein
VRLGPRRCALPSQQSKEHVEVSDGDIEARATQVLARGWQGGRGDRQGGRRQPWPARSGPMAAPRRDQIQSATTD